jgi:hypothetical protein
MDVNYNPIMKYNLHGGDLAIVLLVIVFRDDMQLNMKHKLDFDDLKSISQQKNPLKVEGLMLLLIIVYITFLLFFIL